MASKFPQKVKNLLELKDKYKAFFFDMDGVYWNGSHKIQNAIDTYQQLKKEGKQCFFITNNSSRSRKTYVEKLRALGVETEEERVFAASSIAAYYIKNNLPNVKKCYVVGMKGICEELANYGIDYIWSNEHHNQSKEMTADEFENLKLDSEVGAVVVGINYEFNYAMMAYASSYIQNGAKFIATNEDKYIMAGGKKMPGGGTIVNAIAFGCDTRPLITGKPNSFVVDLLCNQYNINKSEAIMIGDNLDTDIALGQNAGLDTLLVMTGVTDENLLKKTVEEGLFVPTYYADSA
ncbi:haloacid dehalogenase-like hydrolase family protein (macronuclear) [Tetrahymena thermophila SB210]|uniref:Haloacid dehalogenase-like hydrolase family protein n=1 Tax=Tetrahymena thermophila (strain SB210) TaxID=312017 RepID=I7MA86_TETTS|nr:haloacid dehalogenase-like hydrolase family protein [Tetrahymena thermophila SB210]EAS03910.2 haloacid dehalogenase-like hydrolase family protein [Tetrahymena thermophila SB210]|eukprot:XP_001024155.2 haloacid dehalogenase-like hydrolase family protein [Tetrahymena thermophila SB210]